MSKSTAGPDLKKYMDKALKVKVNGNRQVSGVLRGRDPRTQRFAGGRRGASAGWRRPLIRSEFGRHRHAPAWFGNRNVVEVHPESGLQLGLAQLACTDIPP